MRLYLRTLIRHCAFLLVLPLLAAFASAHEGHDYLFDQNFGAAPPELDGLVETWVDWVGYGEYERTGGQPFAGAVPPNLPAEVTDIYIDIEAGSEHRSNGCVYTWKEVFVWIKFSDGSSFVWWSIHTELDCPGSVEVFDNVIATGGVEDPITGAWSGWVRSYSAEDLQVARRAAFRGTGNAVADLTSLSARPRPLIGPENQDVDVTLAPGGVFDLRGFNGAAGFLIETDQPITLYCDTILLDPGVVLYDLISPPPVVLSGAIVHEMALLGGSPTMLQEGPATKRLWALNLGNASTLSDVHFIDVLGWTFGGPVQLPVPPMHASSFQLPIQVPPGVPPGTASQVQMTLQSGPNQQFETFTLTRAQDSAPGAQIYCSAKLNSLGCLPSISATGNASLTGNDDFVLHATDVLPNKFGIAFHGSNPAQIPLQGGWLCVQAPLVRTPPRLAAPLNSGALCDGWYSFHVTQEYLADHSLTPGMTVHAQWWSRDPAAPFGTGLSNAVSFTVGL